MTIPAALLAQQQRTQTIDEPAAAAGEDRWPVAEARPILLAAAGGKRTDAPALRGDGTPDCRPTSGHGVGGIGRQDRTEEEGAEEEECTWKSLKRCGLPVLKFCSRWKLTFGGAKAQRRKEIADLRIRKCKCDVY